MAETCKTIARPVFYAAFLLLVGLCTGFVAYPQVVGHKLWLMSWAYQSIFRPPEYRAWAVTWIAERKLFAHFFDKEDVRILECREDGEEMRVFVVQYAGPDGHPVIENKRIWVRWKLWTQNNGEDLIYKGGEPRPQDSLIVEIQDAE